MLKLYFWCFKGGGAVWVEFNIISVHIKPYLASSDTVINEYNELKSVWKVNLR
jgi:hypothetical protein